MWNTLIVGLGTALSGAAFYALVAYVVVRRQFKGRAILDFISWLPWAIPGILMGLALLWTVFETRIFLPLYGSVYLLIIALFIKSMPFGVQIAERHALDEQSDDQQVNRAVQGKIPRFENSPQKRQSHQDARNRQGATR